MGDIPPLQARLGQLLSKLAALDGIPVHAISRSDYIRKSLDRDGFSLPKNPTDIMKMIQGYADRGRTQMVAEFKQRIDAGERFSLTLDEWTSVRNRRYMNINLHGTGTDFWNLGLQRVTGKFTSEAMVSAVKDHLNDFGVSVDSHCVVCTSDGASVMCKFLRLMPTVGVTCYSHGIHLSVGYVMYKNTPKDFDNEDDDGDDDTQGTDVDNPESDSASEEIEVSENIVVESFETDSAELNESYASLIGKVREDCKKFRRGRADEILQGYVMNEFGHELKPVIDVKSRWNTIESMLTRYIKLRPCILKAFVFRFLDRN